MISSPAARTVANIVIGAVALIGVTSLTITGNVVHADQLRDADIRYSRAIAADRVGYDSLKTALSSAAPAAGLKSSDVDDPGMLAMFQASYASTRGIEKPLYATANARGADENALDAASDRLDAQRVSYATAADGVRLNSTQVMASHHRRLVANAKAALDGEIAKARSLMSASEGNVDDESARTDLMNAIKKAVAAPADDIKGMDSLRSSLTRAENGATAAVNARSARLQAEQRAAEAAASAQASAGAYRSNGSSSYSGSSSRSYASNGSSSSAGGYWSSGSCTPTAENGWCQGAVDTGGLINNSYYGGATNIYAQHDLTGGDWINHLSNGQTFNLNGQTYKVVSNAVNQTTAPSSGTYMQTCTNNGQGIRLVGIQKQ
jgi:hypothetical protein